MRLEGFSGGAYPPDASDVYLLQRFRFNMAVSPTSWLRIFSQTQDSRALWKSQKPVGPPYQDTFDLRQAYIEFGDSDTKHARLRVGRQEINFGDERLVGSSNWTNTARTFDAARATIHWSKYRLDAFAASPVVLHDGDVGDHVPGNNIHGLYGGLENVVPRATIEPYVFWRLSQRLKTEIGTVGNLDFTAAGVRWVGKLPHGFDYATEMAREQGSLGADRIAAWAGHWVAGYTAPVAWKPRFLVEYNYATGDRNPHDGRRTTFDQLFPTNHEKFGLADQASWKNISHARAGIELKPRPKWTVATKFNAFWLANAHDALYNSSGTAIAVRADGSAGRFVGTELDSFSAYTYSKQLQIGAGFGHIFPGNFLRATTQGRGYNAPYVMVTAGL